MAINPEIDTPDKLQGFYSTVANMPDDAPEVAQEDQPAPVTPAKEIQSQYNPENPYALGVDGKIDYSSGDVGDGLKQESSFLGTAKAEYYDWNSAVEAAHAGYEYASEPTATDDIPKPGWNAKTDIENFSNVDEQYIPYLLAATGPRDQQFRLQRVYDEQNHNETLKDGSFVAKLLGGALGMVTDPTNLIPVVGWAKYGKFGEGMLKNIMHGAPGITAWAAADSASKQMDKINGNIQDFALDTFVNASFGTALWGLGGAVELSTEKMNLWNLRGLAKGHIDGIDFKLNMDDKGVITGIKALDPAGSLSAAKVDQAQKLADSEFAKTGLFKIPYVGTGVLKALSMPVFGTPLPRLLNSPFPTMRGIADRVASHSIITESLLKGETAPYKFQDLMNQTHAEIRGLSVQMNALHTERNGFDITNRHANSLVNTGMALKAKALNLLRKETDTGWISREQFDQEVEHTLSEQEPSQHAAVNTAAAMHRKIRDEHFARLREAFNLPKDWMPPRTQAGHVSRVYDTPYMNTHEEGEGGWIPVISGALKEQDETIQNRMQPINDLTDSIKNFESEHSEAFKELGRRELQLHPARDVAYPAEEGVSIRKFVEPVKNYKKRTFGNRETKLIPHEEIRETHRGMRAKLKAMREQLQNELRHNEDLNLLVDDPNALSADEGKELSGLLQPTKNLETKVEEQKEVLRQTKAKVSSDLSAAKKSKTVEEAKPKAEKYAASQEKITIEENKLHEYQRELDTEKDRLQEMAHKGEINPRFYVRSKDSFHYEFKDPKDRLKFRDVHESDDHRRAAAKAYYDTILNQTPEDTINQVMGRYTGNSAENPIKQRTIMLPDKLLRENNFLTKDLMAKTANYCMWMARRTHMKTAFKDATLEGGFEPLLAQLNADHETLRQPLIEKNDEKGLAKLRKQFDTAKSDATFIYQKMMGINTTSKVARQIRTATMALTGITNLAFVPWTMINDLGANGLQHGVWPFIQSGLYPLITSLNGILKTKDSEAFRNVCPSIHLALQDTNLAYSDRNWGMNTNPYLNMGKFVDTLQHIAHLNTNFTGTNLIDNTLQRTASSIYQANLMKILFDFKAGRMSKRDGLYIRKYGIDPEKWADRMIAAYKEAGGYRTKLGGYQSLFYRWQDLEAANKFGDSVFRSVKDTNINAGILDSPMWLDDNGPIGIAGAFLKGFNGWGYASINRYLIPFLQQPDAKKLLGVSLMLGTGYMVDPLRRWARGEDAFPDNITEAQRFASALNNSGVFSEFANVLQDANLLSGDQLLGNLKNDKYKDRTRAGLLGPSWGTANNMVDIIDSLASGEWNKKDAEKAARMIPFANSSWTYWMSKSFIDHLNIPDTKAQAAAERGVA